MSTVTWTVVVAAGSGSRFGRPKQFEEIEGTRVVDRSMATARAASDGVVLVVPAELVAAEAAGSADSVVAGGSTRSASVRAGLAAVPADADVILVHDAARPLADAALFARVVAAIADGADGAVPAVPVTDTVVESDGDLDGRPLGARLDRSRLAAVQTPQGFRAGALRAAHASEPEATDDAALVVAAGGKVVFVPGDPSNLKITHRADLSVAAALLRDRA